MPFVLKETVIINEGKNWYGDAITTNSMLDLVALGNEEDSHVGCRWGHPSSEISSAPPKIVGQYINFKIKRTGDKNSVVADLHVFDTAKEFTYDGGKLSIYDYLKKNAKKHSEFFGNSIVAERTEDCNPAVELRFEKLDFVDLVSEPAATNSLYNSKNFSNMSLKNILSRLTSIEQKMGKTKTAILSIPAKSKDGKQVVLNRTIKLDVSSTLPDGTIVDIVGDSTTIPIEGDVALVDGTPAPAGEHILTSLGYIILVEDTGEITEVRPIEDNEDSDMDKDDDQPDLSKDKDKDKDDETDTDVELNTRLDQIEQAVGKIADIVQAQNKSIQATKFSKPPAPSIGQPSGKTAPDTGGNWIDQAIAEIKHNKTTKK